MQSIDPAIALDLKYAAVVNEIPTPVANATYAATHNGHFGITTKIVPGTIHFAVETLRPSKVVCVFSQHK